MWHSIAMKSKVRHIKEIYPDILEVALFTGKDANGNLSFQISKGSSSHQPTTTSESPSGQSMHSSSQMTSENTDTSQEDAPRGMDGLERANVLGSIRKYTLGDLKASKRPLDPVTILEILHTLDRGENLNEMLSFFMSQLLIRTGIYLILYISSLIGANAGGFFMSESKGNAFAALLEAMAWIDSENTLNLLFDTRLPTAKKELHVPISIINHVQKSSIIVLNDPASKWPVDRYLSSGYHPWFLIMPIVKQGVSGSNSGSILGSNTGSKDSSSSGASITLFLEFPTRTTFSKDELSGINGLCVQATVCLKSVIRKKQLSETAQQLADAREQLFTYSRTLEQKIRTRTLELLDQTNALRTEVKDRIRAQEESAIQQAKAENALRVKEQFLATMSHELRTPFNGVLGMIQLLSGTELTPKQREHLNVLNESSMNLLNLLNDILDYTKIESGHLEFHKSIASVREICESVVNEHFDTAEAKAIDLAYVSENEETDWIVVDPVRLRQLIKCYVENAIKFNSDRGGYILVTSLMSFVGDADEEHPARYRLSVSCADTGPGIADVSGLFTPFSQVDNSIRRQYGGTGLGLAICKRLVELTNGDAWCHSVVDQGSTFYFSFVLYPGDRRLMCIGSRSRYHPAGSQALQLPREIFDFEVSRPYGSEQAARLSH